MLILGQPREFYLRRRLDPQTGDEAGTTEGDFEVRAATRLEISAPLLAGLHGKRRI